MSSLRLREIIYQLNRLNVETAEFDYIASLFLSAAKGLRVYVRNSRTSDLYFRARVCNQYKPATVGELGAPPACLVTGFQRCNPPGAPVFYSASKRITALLECDVVTGDVVYLSQWMCTDQAPVTCVLAPPTDRDIGLRRTPQSVNEAILCAYLDTIFTRPIHSSFSSQYKLTAAATQVLTTGFDRSAGSSVGEDRTVGIIYPSVASVYDGHNIAFHASFANARLKLLHVMQLRIVSRHGHLVEADVLDNAIEFPNSTISWLGTPHAIPLLVVQPERGVMFVKNERTWVIPVRSDTSTREDIDALLQESFASPWNDLLPASHVPGLHDTLHA